MVVTRDEHDDLAAVATLDRVQAELQTLSSRAAAVRFEMTQVLGPLPGLPAIADGTAAAADCVQPELSCVRRAGEP